jgi:hypothetical protein
MALPNRLYFPPQGQTFREAEASVGWGEERTPAYCSGRLVGAFLTPLLTKGGVFCEKGSAGSSLES